MNSVPVLLTIILLSSVIERPRADDECTSQCVGTYNACFSGCIGWGECQSCQSGKENCLSSCKKKREFLTSQEAGIETRNEGHKERKFSLNKQGNKKWKMPL